ncbi:MAG: ParB N-terminal domain-containing protein [Eubacteriales bacterium]|nr:ParB N-terminal domain-containing protein [Eubacteriales bacterium]
MNIVFKRLDELHSYEQNPRRNDEAVQYVVASIKEFGFRVPILIDCNGIIIAGYTRRKAACQLQLERVPCIIADDLTDEQIRAYRIIDNKVAEMSEWDYDLLNAEMDELDFDWGDFGFVDCEDEELFDDAPDLEKIYQEPEITRLQCPKCGHIDSKVRFKTA